MQYAQATTLASPALPRRARTVAATGVPTPELPSGDLIQLLDHLVDAIDVRESYEPEIASWDTSLLIRRLERELADSWRARRSALSGIIGTAR